MIKFWVVRGIKNRIVTTRYPRTSPSPEEIPRRAIPPISLPESDWAQGEELCPTNAIKDSTGSKSGIELGKCIYCRRCTEAGFEFDDISDKMDAALQARAVLASRPQVQGLDAGEFSNSKARIFKKSHHILMIDVGSCNACNLEVLNLLNSYYDLTRLGIFFTNSPKHADTLVVVGALNEAMVEALKRTYESMPNPKLVVSVGACAISGGIFQDTESFVSPLNDVMPVDVEVPGCPPSPIQILEGLLLAMSRLEKKSHRGDKSEDKSKLNTTTSNTAASTASGGAADG
jgi:Ni,Fe-hydrogenase III small subunit